jgi:hypothetical protein
MQNSPLAQDLKLKAELHGGQFSFRPVEGCLNLVTYKPGEKSRPDEMSAVVTYSYRFIEDSVAANKLLKLADYRILVDKDYLRTKLPRTRYSAVDDRKIRDYVKATPGRNKGLVYWENAVKKGLFSNHTPNSLKIHWKTLNVVICKRTKKRCKHTKDGYVPPPPEMEFPGGYLPFKQQDRRRTCHPVITEDMEETKVKIEEETKVKVEEEEPVVIDIKWSVARSAETALKQRAEHRGRPTVLDAFHNLVKECRVLSRTAGLDERTVLERLLHFKGRSSLVRSFFIKEAA